MRSLLEKSAILCAIFADFGKNSFQRVWNLAPAFFLFGFLFQKLAVSDFSVLSSLSQNQGKS